MRIVLALTFLAGFDASPAEDGWEETLPPMSQVCVAVLEEFVERENPGDLFRSILADDIAGITRESVDSVGNYGEALAAASQVGSRDLIHKLYQLRRDDAYVGEGFVFAEQAALCSNSPGLRYWIHERGVNPDLQPRKTVSDLMVTAIMNKDAESVRILFEGGYSKCSYRTPNGLTLPQIADNKGLVEFKEIYSAYCLRT